MNLRQRIGLSPRALRIECLEQRRLFVASLDVQASIKTVDADNAPGIILTAGENAATTYRVTNTGDVALTDLAVVDDNGTPSPDDDIVANPRITAGGVKGTLVSTRTDGFVHDFVLHPTLPRMYISVEGPGFGGDKILVVNTETLAVTSVDAGSTEPTHLAISNDGTRLYLGTQAGGYSVGVMDTTTNTMLPDIDVGGWAYDGLEVGADGRLFVHSIGDIDQLSPHTGAEVGPKITLPGHDFYYGHSVVSADKTRLYYASSSPVWSTFNQIDLTTDPPTRLWRYQSDSEGLDIALTKDGAYVSFIADPGVEGYTGIPKFRTSDMAVVGTFNAGGIPREMVYSPDGRTAYIVSTTGAITVWDAITFQKIGTIAVAGGEPVEMQIDASGKYLFVSVDGATDSLHVYNLERGVRNLGDTNDNQRIDPGEAWSFEATITAQPGPHVHVATATAYANGTVAITDTDPSHYLVYTTWEGEAPVPENVSGAMVGPLPSYPWPGPWTVSDSRFEIVQNKLQLKVGQHLTLSEDDGTVVEVWTTQSTPFLQARFTLDVTANNRAWHRPGEPRDVDGDGHIVAGDALAVINQLHLNQGAPSSLLGPRPANLHYIDVNGDGHLTAGDALAVINWLHANPVSLQGEGEGESAVATHHDSSLLLLVDHEEPRASVTEAIMEEAAVLLSPQSAVVATDWVFDLTETEQSTTRSRRSTGGVSSDGAGWWPTGELEESDSTSGQ